MRVQIYRQIKKKGLIHFFKIRTLLCLLQMHVLFLFIKQRIKLADNVPPYRYQKLKRIFYVKNQIDSFLVCCSCSFNTKEKLLYTHVCGYKIRVSDKYLLRRLDE